MDFKKIDKHFNDVSYYKRPDYMTLEEWQYALRKQYALKHSFKIENIGGHAVFSDYNVFNPETKNSYKVAIRSRDNSMNFCSCNDFKTNLLGTCKHIEAVILYINKDAELYEIFKKEEYCRAYTSVYLKYAGKREVMLRIGYENSEEFKKLAEKYFENFVLRESSYDKIEDLINEACFIHSGFRCYSDAIEFIIETREKEKRKKLIFDKYQNDKGFEKIIRTELFPYQKEGVLFAVKAGKCLIADDMGLGKTIQAISTAELLKNETGISNVIIICPTSLKYQWKAEIERFTQSTVLVIDGIVTKRTEKYNKDVSYKIVSYHTAVNDIDYINSSSPDLIILDEAQRIKNFKAKVSQNIKKINSVYKIVLTGTPLENKLEELYSIIQFVDPFKLGPFHQYLAEHRILNENGKVIGYQKLNEIGSILSDVMLRRKKFDVQLQLPERIDKNLMVPMMPEQQNIHQEYSRNVTMLINKWKRFGYLKENDRQRLMIFLNSMRMVCDSTYILDQESRFDTKIDELMSILDEFFEEGNEKVVIFSQWERMTRLVAKELKLRNIWFENLHGGVPGDKREILFKNFNNEHECKVFLSTDAGGVGLNLQAASLLINLDIPWNPAVEQRIARIYRIGQKRKVNIINMVSVDSIEERMLQVIGFKKLMAEGILDKGDDTIFMGQDKFRKFIETVETIVGQPKPEPVLDTVTNEDHEPLEIIEEPAGQIEKEPVQQILFGDDDILAPQKPITPEKHNEDVQAQELVNMGINFFGKLVKTLSDPDSTGKLVQSLVKKDENGNSYLKIPVENEKSVENAIQLISGILKNIKI